MRCTILSGCCRAVSKVSAGSLSLSSRCLPLCVCLCVSLFLPRRLCSSRQQLPSFNSGDEKGGGERNSLHLDKEEEGRGREVGGELKSRPGAVRWLGFLGCDWLEEGRNYSANMTIISCLATAHQSRETTQAGQPCVCISNFRGALKRSSLLCMQCFH